MKNNLQLILLSLTSFLYAFFLPSLSGAADSYVTIPFVLFLFYMIFKSSSLDVNKLSCVKYIVQVNLALYLSLIVGFKFGNYSILSVWMPDSFYIHLPRAVNFAAFLHGVADIKSSTSEFDNLFFAHVWMGLFYYLFGVGIYVTLLAIMPIKILTSVLIYKSAKILFGKRAGLTSALLYACSPTVLFYTLTFYKEYALHLLVSMSVLLFIKLTKKFTFHNLFLLVMTILLLVNERYYVGVFTSIPCFWYFFFSSNTSRNLKASAVMLGVLGVVFFFYSYSEFHFTTILSDLRTFRNAMNSYSDVSGLNMSLPYPLAFLKVLFTPFFTLSKLDMMFDTSYLLIWGSFINQIIIMLGVFGFLRSLKKSFLMTISLGLPFIVLLLLFAYIAPYSGRVRDSYYPIIVLFGGNMFLILKSKLKNIVLRKGFVVVMLLALLPLRTYAYIFWSAPLGLQAVKSDSATTMISNNGVDYYFTMADVNYDIYMAYRERGSNHWLSARYIEDVENVKEPSPFVYEGKVYFAHIGADEAVRFYNASDLKHVDLKIDKARYIKVVTYDGTIKLLIGYPSSNRVVDVTSLAIGDMENINVPGEIVDACAYGESTYFVTYNSGKVSIFELKKDGFTGLVSELSSLSPPGLACDKSLYIALTKASLKSDSTIVDIYELEGTDLKQISSKLEELPTAKKPYIYYSNGRIILTTTQKDKLVLIRSSTVKLPKGLFEIFFEKIFN